MNNIQITFVIGIDTPPPPNLVRVWTHNLLLYTSGLDTCLLFQPPLENKLLSSWQGETTEFGGTSNYTCATDNIFFEHDKELEAYDVYCQTDGSFTEPDEWPRCLASKI